MYLIAVRWESVTLLFFLLKYSCIVPWRTVMWLGNVECRHPFNPTFKIKVIWEQNHVSGDSFSFLCFPGCKKGFPVTFCLALLPSAQCCEPHWAQQAALQGPKGREHLSCGPPCQKRQSWGGREDERQSRRETVHLYLKQTCTWWGFLTFHVPVQDALFQSPWGHNCHYLKCMWYLFCRIWL